MDKKMLFKGLKVAALVLLVVSFFLPFIRLQLAAMGIDNAHNVFAEDLNVDDPANLIGYIGILLALVTGVLLFIETPVEKYSYLSGMVLVLIVLIVGQSLVFGSDRVQALEAANGTASMGFGLLLGYISVVVGLVAEVLSRYVLKVE